MKDSALRLQDKTILLVGPFNGVTQAILRTMTEFGADIGYVGEQAQSAAKYIDGLNEAREVHPQYGRAAHYALPLENEKQMQEALGRVAESLGRMDALIDARPLAWSQQTDAAKDLQKSLLLTEKLMPFLLAKQRGRILYVFEDACLDPLNGVTVAPAWREILLAQLGALANHHRAQNVTVNGLTVGVTDDFLLQHFPKGGSLKKAFEELRLKHPALKLVEFHDVGLGAAYLTSALSACVTGQLLRLTHGFHLSSPE